MKTKTYYISLLSLFLAPYLMSQSSTQNYIQKIIPTQATTGKTSYNPAEAIIQIDYFDGLGRPVQTVQKGITPTQRDMVTLTEYNRYGEVNRQWIPVPIAGNNGEYVSSSSFISTSKSYYNDNYPNEEIRYENSAVKRVAHTRGPGQNWEENKRYIATSYLTNPESYDSKPELRALPFGVENGQLRSYDEWFPNSLQIVRTWDEDLRYTYTFMDTKGRVILQRKVLGTREYHDTHYVYDGRGNLCFVLPPMASDQLTAENTTYATTNQVLQLYAYIYTYDAKGRCITKKIPGADPFYYVYDAGDLLALMQDGNQRQKSEWTVTKYDELSRPVLVGTTVLANKTHTQLQQEFRNTRMIEVRDDTEMYYHHVNRGYTQTTFPTINANYHTAMYYGDYDFLPSSSPLKYVASSQGDDADLKANGMLTGVYTQMLNDRSSFVLTAYYYNKKGRVVQERSINLMGGRDISYTKYNFIGNPTYTYREHQGYHGLVTEAYAFTYDHAGRLTKTTHRLNGGTEKSINIMTYNELGQLRQKTFQQGMSPITYTYHLRGWLKSISGLYQQRNYYEDGGTISLNNSYSGNITRIESTTPYADPTSWMLPYPSPRTTWYTYDKLNRLTSSWSRTAGMETDYLDEMFSYDKNGNIKTLTRMYKESTEDMMIFTYRGNQLFTVMDEYNVSRYQDELIQFTGMNVSGQGFYYDANGNLTKDRSRKISSVSYNHLNLPDRITFENGNQINYTYGADGKKYAAYYQTVSAKVFLPLGEQIGSNMVSAQADMIEYCGNYIYENGILTKILTPEGYITYDIYSGSGTYFYYHKDHLGSNRLVVRENSTFFQAMEYFPSGIPIFKKTKGYDNRLHTGKEFEEMHGLNWYDNDARMYDAIFARFTTLDPLAEKYYDTSPYAHCGNNPMNAMDINGDSITVLNLGYGRNQHLGILIKNEDGKWNYYSVNGDNVYSSGRHRGGRESDDLEVGVFDSPQQFLNSDYNTKGSKYDKSINSYGYSEGYIIPTTLEQDNTIRKKFTDISRNEEYSLDPSNPNHCGTAVQRSLFEAGIQTKEYKGDRGLINPYLPSSAFKAIMNRNPQGSYIKKQK